MIKQRGLALPDSPLSMEIPTKEPYNQDKYYCPNYRPLDRYRRRAVPPVVIIIIIIIIVPARLPLAQYQVHLCSYVVANFNSLGLETTEMRLPRLDCLKGVTARGYCYVWQVQRESMLLVEEVEAAVKEQFETRVCFQRDNV